MLELVVHRAFIRQRRNGGEHEAGHHPGGAGEEEINMTFSAVNLVLELELRKEESLDLLFGPSFHHLPWHVHKMFSVIQFMWQTNQILCYAMKAFTCFYTSVNQS